MFGARIHISHFLSCWKSACGRKRERPSLQAVKKRLNRFSAQVLRLETQYGGARAIHLTDETFQIRAHQSVAHAFQDVFGFRLQAGHLPVLIP